MNENWAGINEKYAEHSTFYAYCPEQKAKAT